MEISRDISRDSVSRDGVSRDVQNEPNRIHCNLCRKDLLRSNWQNHIETATHKKI